MTRLALLCALVFLSCGCVILDRTPPPQDLVPFETGKPGAAPLRRVAVVPLAIEGTDEAVARAFREDLRGAITQRRLFEALPVSGTDLDDIDLGSARSRGVYSTQDLLTLNRRFGVDAVLAGSLTESRTYPSIRMGLRLFLLDCRTGRVAWATDLMVDAADQAVAADAHNYYDTLYEDPSTSLIEHKKVLISPLLFRRYLAARVAETIYRALNPRPAPISEAP